MMPKAKLHATREFPIVAIVRKEYESHRIHWVPDVPVPVIYAAAVHNTITVPIGLHCYNPYAGVIRVAITIDEVHQHFGRPSTYHNVVSANEVRHAPDRNAWYQEELYFDLYHTVEKPWMDNTLGFRVGLRCWYHGHYSDEEDGQDTSHWGEWEYRTYSIVFKKPTTPAATQPWIEWADDLGADFTSMTANYKERLSFKPPNTGTSRSRRAKPPTKPAAKKKKATRKT